MCGRYVIFTDEDYEEINNIINEVSVKYKDSNVSKGEAFPTNNVPVVYSHNGRRILSAAKWGFPNYNNSGVVINARSETLAEKPMFRNSFAAKRCLVPASAYFEWLTEGKKKTKYLIKPNEKSLFFMAGLYNIFADKNGISYPAITIVTTEANPEISFIHNRMPVILQENAVDIWLDDKITDAGRLQMLLESLDSGKMNYEVA